MRFAARLTLLAASLLSGCAAQQQRHAASPEQVTAQRLETPVTATSRLLPGQEYIVDELVLVARQRVPYHAHPGIEILRVLSGDVMLSVDREGHMHLCAGHSREIPARTGHYAQAGDAGAELLIVRIHPIGQAIRIPDGAIPAQPMPDMLREPLGCPNPMVDR